MTTLFRRWCVVLLVVAGTAGCDGVTKHLASEHLAGLPAQSFLADTIRLTYSENPGAFLSLGANMPEPARRAVFTAAVGAVLFLLAAITWRNGWQRWRTVAFLLFIAGGFSNWVDRLVDGRVTDFLNVGIGGLRTGIFNVADLAILAGVVVFLLVEHRVAASDR